MVRFTRAFALIMTAVFLLSVLTVEPEYEQGYQNDDFPVFVENDAVFVIAGNEFTITVECLSLSEYIPLPHDSRPIPSPLNSTNPTRGPPQPFVS